MIELSGRRPLRNPVMITAFEGWNDAAEAATDAVETLELAWHAEPLGEIDPDDYYDFQVNRPTVALIDGVSRRITWPTSRLSLARPPDCDRDVVLLRGLEPNMRWRAFCAELIDAATQLGVTEVINLGALLSDSPHSRPVPVTGSATDSATARRLGLEQSRYEGPTGIVGVFNDACIQAGIPSTSLWAAVPHYAASPPCPKATLALLRHVENALDIPMPYGDLPDLAVAWERSVDQLAEEDAEIGEYVRALEQQKDDPEVPEDAGEAIAREFERYLRHRREGSN
ncbi:MAG: PAC2 family protein [Acidothermus sp.]|nr:PAC2 family protein [Acidothermus sp.]MCL6537993.1 PAC2 family protein [Acidothermus sp.]